MSKIVISEDLTKLLEKIQENEIAKAITEKEIDEEAERYINYLGLSEKNEGYISYSTKDRIEKFPNEIWNSKRRYMKKPTALVAELFKNEYSQRQIEIFGDLFRNLFKQEVVDTTKLKLVEGEDIRRWYNGRYYASRNYNESSATSDINQSCMRRSSCEDYFDIYCKNTNHVSMAVLFDENEKVKSRCIIWYPEGKENSKEIFYDRIYSVDKKTEDEVQAMLDKMGFINISYKNYVKPSRERQIKIKLDFGQHDMDYFPYMDTFYYINGRSLTNYSTGDCYELQDQEGGIEDDRIECECCGVRVNDTYTICRGGARYSSYCEDCTVYSEEYSGYIAESEATELSNGTWVLVEDAIETYDDRYVYVSNVIELYDGKYAEDNDSDLREDVEGNYFIDGDENFVLVEGSEDYYQKDSSDIEEIEGNYYLIGSTEYESILEQLSEVEN